MTRRTHAYVRSLDPHHVSLRLNLGRAILMASYTYATRQVRTGCHKGRPDAPPQHQVFTRPCATRERPNTPNKMAPRRQVTSREHLEPQIHDRTRQMLRNRMLTHVRSFDCSPFEILQLAPHLCHHASDTTGHTLYASGRNSALAGHSTDRDRKRLLVL
jgi:hypothetical protein